ncbi:hypothetical protein C0J50_16164, partial [Silurus asotus]
PCGKVSSLSQWDSHQSSNIRSKFEGLDCRAEECPWQALLRNSDSKGFCSGVIIKENFVLTTAQCAGKYPDFQVAVGKRLTSYETGEQNLYVKHVHVHPLFMEGKPENDLAVIELKEKIIFKKSVVAACLPERDFAETLLMSGEHLGVITGWKDASEFDGNLRLNHLSYSKLPSCVERHSGRVSAFLYQTTIYSTSLQCSVLNLILIISVANKVTNKMSCTLQSPKADCFFGPGSPVLTLYREVFFLTGVVSQSQGVECSNGYVFQKVSRFIPWLRNVM